MKKVLTAVVVALVLALGVVAIANLANPTVEVAIDPPNM